jgi:hypothetical protein
MPLTPRPTGLSSPAYGDKLDYVVCEDGKVIGRIYEDWHTLPDLRWFWSIAVYVDRRLGIITSGRAASLETHKYDLRAFFNLPAAMCWTIRCDTSGACVSGPM